jgi:opacity protein-like surface antigen
VSFKHFGISLISLLVSDFSELVAQSESAVSPKASAEIELNKNTPTESTIPSPLLKVPENNVDMSTLSENKDSQDISSAFAKNGFYVAPTIGAALVQDIDLSISGSDQYYSSIVVSGSLTFNPGVRFDLPVGYRVNDWLNVELVPGVIYNTIQSIQGSGVFTLSDWWASIDPALVGTKSQSAFASIESGNLIQVPLMVNVLFTIPTGSEWEPFVGGGIGAIYLSRTLNYPQVSFTDNCWSQSYSALAGLNYHYDKDISIGVVYKFNGTGDQATFLNKQAVYTQSAQLNATFRF